MLRGGGRGGGSFCDFLLGFLYNKPTKKEYTFYAPPQKVAGYYVIPSELLSVCPSVRPSAVEHSCPVNNFDTV